MTRPVPRAAPRTRAARRPPVILLLFALFATLPTAACASVRLVAQYDEQIDESATRLQREMDTFLTEMELLPVGDPGRTYEARRDFYVRHAVGLRALRARATALQKNSITVQQVEMMERSLEQIRRVHQSQNTLSPAAATPARELFNTAWTAILTYELAKKR